MIRKIVSILTHVVEKAPPCIACGIKPAKREHVDCCSDTCSLACINNYIVEHDIAYVRYWKSKK